MKKTTLASFGIACVIVVGLFSLYFYGIISQENPNRTDRVDCQLVNYNIRYVISSTISVANGTEYRTTSDFSTTTTLIMTVSYATTVIGNTSTLMYSGYPALDWNRTVCTWVK